ncbi:MAG TPA: hypothetical protein VKR53_16870 [Puia sp.]|nr:hypothetical protein [Puia sp.]
MKLEILFYLLSVLLVTSGKGQQDPTEHPKILLLNAGNPTWPVKLTKQWFEGDPQYMLTFRNAKFKSFKITGQGFFKFEFKEFGKALQMALSTEASSTVKFSEGVIKILSGKPGKKKVECRFATGTGIFRANESDVKMIICTIKKEE